MTIVHIQTHRFHIVRQGELISNVRFYHKWLERKYDIQCTSFQKDCQRTNRSYHQLRNDIVHY